MDRRHMRTGVLAALGAGVAAAVAFLLFRLLTHPTPAPTADRPASPLAPLQGGEPRCASSATPEELFARYECIFPNRNRNAAAHLWAQHVLAHAHRLTVRQFAAQMRAFCPVSGSPIRAGAAAFAYRDVPVANGPSLAHATVRHCCWPCQCDLDDALRTGTVRVVAARVPCSDGEARVHLLVLRDPCGPDAPSLPEAAADVRCEGGVLSGSARLDGGAVIGLIDDDGDRGGGGDLGTRCVDRRDRGHKSGMGTIFRRVAGL